MVVAVVTVRVMQVTVDKIIDVIAVGYRFVSTSGAVNMVDSVAPTSMRWRASRGIGLTNGDRVLLDLPIGQDVMEVAVVQVVDVTLVSNTGVLAVGTVLVVMMIV